MPATFSRDLNNAKRTSGANFASKAISVFKCDYLTAEKHDKNFLVFFIKEPKNSCNYLRYLV